MLGLILCLCCSEICGNFNIKLYADKKKLKHLFIALLSYAFMIFFLLKLFQAKKSMMHLNVTWQALVVILGSITSYIVLGDRLTHPVQILGIVFAILSIVCINWKS
jgi:multidrug transporter EmrE-like cation transporter